MAAAAPTAAAAAVAASTSASTPIASCAASSTLPRGFTKQHPTPPPHRGLAVCTSAHAARRVQAECADFEAGLFAGRESAHLADLTHRVGTAA
eukprot:3076644-Pleurochrysis_carterae.AAC.2